jgi:hypothetical protein
MSDAPLIQLIRAEMQRFTGRQYQIAFDQFDAKSLQELLRFLLDAEYEQSVSPLPGAQPGVPRTANQKNAARDGLAGQPPPPRPASLGLSSTLPCQFA